MYIQPWLIGKSETETRLERLEASIMQLQTSVANSSAAMAETLKAIQESLALQRDRSVQVHFLLLAVCLLKGQILFRIWVKTCMANSVQAKGVNITWQMSHIYVQISLEKKREKNMSQKMGWTSLDRCHTCMFRCHWGQNLFILILFLCPNKGVNITWQMSHM